MSQTSNKKNEIVPVDAHFSTENDVKDSAAWTEIEEGRFMPRRVRGSCHGRALG